MYAIIQDGGHQYRVSEGEQLLVDLKDLEPGTPIDFDHVLMYANDGDVRIGQPTLPDVKVTAEVVRMEKGEKLTIMRFRRRKNSRTKNGHRQKYTCVAIKKITAQ